MSFSCSQKIVRAASMHMYGMYDHLRVYSLAFMALIVDIEDGATNVLHYFGPDKFLTYAESFDSKVCMLWTQLCKKYQLQKYLQTKFMTECLQKEYSQSFNSSIRKGARKNSFMCKVCHTNF